MRRRHHAFTKKLGAAICARLANGESLRSICSSPDMTSRRSVTRWAMERSDFREAYQIALEFQRDSWADMIADAGDGIPAEDVPRAKLASDDKKWLLSRLHPQKFGDKASVQLSGDADRPVAVEVSRPLCAPEIASGIRALLEENEAAVGLAPAPALPDAARLKRILNENAPITPGLYSAIAASREGASGLSYDSQGKLNRRGN